MRRSTLRLGAAAAGYALLTVGLTWPLVRHPGSRVPNDLGDALLNMFLIAWNARVLPLSDAWWSAPQFFPLPGATAFSEHLLGLAPITTPVFLATGNAVLAYNAAFFLSFPLSAFGAHLLGFELTRRHGAAIIAGLAYGFAPYRVSQLAHVQVLSAYWIPFALASLHVFARTGRSRWAAAFAVCWLMQALTCGYYLFYFSVLIALWLAWFGPGRITLRALAILGACWAGAALALLPIALGYLRYQRAYGLRRWPFEIQSFSADAASLLSAPGDLRLWGWLDVVSRAEGELFPGLTLTAIVLTGVFTAWARLRSGQSSSRASMWLMVIAAVLAAAAALPFVHGPWRLTIGSVRLLSISSFQKPLSLALLATAAAVALHPAIHTAWRRRSPLAFYALAAVVMWLFSLGPEPTLLGRPLLYKAPYAWLMELPGVDGLRVPARFWMLSVACLAAAAAAAIGHVRLPSGGRTLVVAGAAVLMLAESWPRPLRLEVPPAHRAAPGGEAGAVRLELPISSESDLAALYRAISHGRPLVNGYSGYFAPHYFVLRHLVDARESAVLTEFASRAPLEIVVGGTAPEAEALREFVASEAGAPVARGADGHAIYRLPRQSAPPHLALSGTSLPVLTVDASSEEERTARMWDGDLVSRWDTGRPQAPGDQLVIDLGVPRRLEGLELQIGGYVADFPRALDLDVSGDGRVWRPVRSGPTAIETLRAALADPRRIPIRFSLHGETARYIRLRQAGSSPEFYWSVAELRVTGYAADAPAPPTSPGRDGSGPGADPALHPPQRGGR